MVVQRPTSCAFDVDGDIKHRSYYYDGSKLTMLVPEQGVYAQTDAPGTVGEVVNGLLNAGVEMPLIDVLRQAFQGSLLEGVRLWLRVGDSTIDGVETDHLAFRQSTIRLAALGGQERAAQEAADHHPLRLGDPQYEVVLDWNTKPKINSSTFKFVPPSGAKQIPFFAPRASSPPPMTGRDGGSP
jgi:hypothetical protein